MQSQFRRLFAFLPAVILLATPASLLAQQIRPSQVNVPEEALDDFRKGLAGGGLN